MYGEGEDPATGKPVKSKYITVVTGKDTRSFEEFIQPEGSKDFVKVMTLSYKRRSK